MLLKGTRQHLAADERTALSIGSARWPPTSAAGPPPRCWFWFDFSHVYGLGFLGRLLPGAAMDDEVDYDFELLDPHPDLHSLFVHYNGLYFNTSLGACSGECLRRHRQQAAAPSPGPLPAACSRVEQQTDDGVWRGMRAQPRWRMPDQAERATLEGGQTSGRDGRGKGNWASYSVKICLQSCPTAATVFQGPEGNAPARDDPCAHDAEW